MTIPGHSNNIINFASASNGQPGHSNNIINFTSASNGQPQYLVIQTASLTSPVPVMGSLVIQTTSLTSPVPVMGSHNTWSFKKHH